MYSKFKLIVMVAVTSALAATHLSCQSGAKSNPGSAAAPNPVADAPVFDADSAYSYIEAQVAFGPRVPGTEAHQRCGNYIRQMVGRTADTVLVQNAIVSAFNGDKLPIQNIFARYNPENNNRILLLAHWDTRPWADADSHVENHNIPIPGANDGGSGVATLIEIGRHIKEMNLPVGVDLLFVDAEDYGRSDGFGSNNETWCLGTQYFIDHLPYTSENTPRYGICLDMVGGNGAVFHREFASNLHAGDIVDHVWNVAVLSGYEDRFINSPGGSIVDDHLFINQAGIPCIDIVELNSRATRTFPATWHTMSDDLDNIDRSSLKAAGQTVLNTLYLESKKK